MLKQIVCVILIVLGLTISLVGCGSETSGSITLVSLTYDNGVATAKATYSPSSGSALPNQPITFYWRTVGKTSGIVVDYPPKDSSTDSLGAASSFLFLPSPRTETLLLYVKAGTGDLTTDLQSVEAP